MWPTKYPLRRKKSFYLIIIERNLAYSPSNFPSTRVVWSTLVPSFMRVKVNMHSTFLALHLGLSTGISLRPNILSFTYSKSMYSILNPTTTVDLPPIPPSYHLVMIEFTMSVGCMVVNTIQHHNHCWFKIRSCSFYTYHIGFVWPANFMEQSVHTTSLIFTFHQSNVTWGTIVTLDRRGFSSYGSSNRDCCKQKIVPWDWRNAVGFASSCDWFFFASCHHLQCKRYYVLWNHDIVLTVDWPLPLIISVSLLQHHVGSRKPERWGALSFVLISMIRGED